MEDILDVASVRRMRVFHAFGVLTAVAATLLSAVLGGDPFARTLFCVGLGLFATANLCLIFVGESVGSIDSPLSLTLWLLAGLGLAPAQYYFGPFSAVVLILPFGALIAAIGRSQAIALGVTAFSVVVHLAFAVPIIAGWIDDVGLIRSQGLSTAKLVVLEALIVVFLVSAYGVGRWVRRTSAQAVDELERGATGVAVDVFGGQRQGQDHQRRRRSR